MGIQRKYSSSTKIVNISKKQLGQGLGSSGDMQTGRFVFFGLFEWEETINQLKIVVSTIDMNLAILCDLSRDGWVNLSRVAGDRPPTIGDKGGHFESGFHGFQSLGFFSNKLLVRKRMPFAIGGTMGSCPQCESQWESSPNIFGIKNVSNFVKPPNLASNLLQSLYVFIYHHFFLMPLGRPPKGLQPKKL